MAFAATPNDKSEPVPVPLPRQSSCNSSLTRNPLTTLDHNRSASEGDPPRRRNTLRLHLSRELVSADKENSPRKLNVEPVNSSKLPAQDFKPTEPDSKIRVGPIDFSGAANVWDHSDSEAAPASSWSNLPNRTLMCKPLPVDVGRCTCLIVKEKLAPVGYVYALYTNEGKGRQDRKLAIASHKRKSGRSVFVVGQNLKGMLSSSDDNFLGTVTSNFMGSKYQIWDQGVRPNWLQTKPKLLQAVVVFTPTIRTWTGSYRSMRAWITKHQSVHQKSSNLSQAQPSTGFPIDWETDADKVQQLCSRPPHYNNITKQNELDFRDRGRSSLRIQKSVKNFQLTPEINGRQTSLQLGRVGKYTYVMDYRHPLTGYQAFCICLASIDSKICCTM